LINFLMNQKEWNKDIIDGIFAPEEAELIYRIPLSATASEDSIFWPLTQDGTYTSKTGYRFLKEESEHEGMDVEKMELKRSIWSMQVPNKVKNFVWRACRNSLPTKTNLVHRKIIDSPICDCCQQCPETVLHSLWSCRELEVVWDEEELWDFH